MSLLKFRVLTSLFYVARELSQPMGKAEFSSNAKNRTNSVTGKKNKTVFGQMQTISIFRVYKNPSRGSLFGITRLAER